MSVGMVVQPYDADQSFPVFGFGGIPRHMGINSVSHCFALNGNAANPEIVGVPNIVGTYKQMQSQIGLGGPTLFAPLLTEFKRCVES
jgi:copine 5/8/9